MGAGFSVMANRIYKPELSVQSAGHSIVAAGGTES